MSVQPETATTTRRWRRWWGRRLVRWLTAAGLVLGLVLLTISLLLGAAQAQRADDPRSTTSAGTGALAQLLSDEGVALVTTDRVDEAAGQSDGSTTLVVAHADRLTSDQARDLLRSPHGRLLLLRANDTALRAFGLDVAVSDTQQTTPPDTTLSPGCADPGDQRAGAIIGNDLTSSYRPVASVELACYPTGAGFAHLRVPAAGGPVELVAGGLANADLGRAGNASFATTVLGSQPRVVWLMAPRPASPTGPVAPTLLPTWWEMAVVQAFLAVVLVGIWRGRRLGPILVEPLPVTVRASETVVGHGRLYYRLGARDRAAEVLRAAARARLGRTFGQRDDPEQLSALLATRTGRDVRSIQHLLDGPPPDSDDDLRVLALSLDRLEQEANRL